VTLERFVLIAQQLPSRLQQLLLSTETAPEVDRRRESGVDSLHRLRSTVLTALLIFFVR